MLNVASEATAQALSRSRQLAARPPQAAHAPATPFASMLDDSAATNQPAQSPADDSARPARTDQPQQPATSADSKAAKTDATDAGTDTNKTADKTAKSDKTGQFDKTDTLDQPTVDAKPAVDAKTAAAAKLVKATVTDGSKPSDGKATDAAAVDPAATPPVNPAQIIKAADVSVVTPAPTIVAPPTPAADDTATPAPTPDALAALQAGTGKAAADPALAAKTAATSQVKPQGPASDADDEAIAHARGEPADQHAVTAPTLDALATDATSAAPKAADIAPPPAPTNPAAALSPAAAAQQAPQAAAIPLAGVAVEIASKAASGKNHFEIRLDPPELGRIEVHLAVDHDGNVTSRLIADRADTLDLLRRDASGLERALQDAGLKTADNSLQFSLRDQSAYQQQQQGHADSDATQLVVEDDTIAIDAMPRSYGRLAGLGGGLDIQV